MTAPRLLLVDGSSYLFRAYHALPPLTTPEGIPTGAVYGVINMLKKLIETESPEYLAVIFDHKGKTFRHDFDPNYKANRPSMPDELAQQIPYVHDIIKAMGIPLIIEAGVEADDVIGTYATQAREAGWQVLISTGDKDMAQLVCPQVSLINTMNNRVSTPESVIEKFGVKAEQIIDYLALMGDKVDNIDGVPGVGPKTAAKWLMQYDSLENLIAHSSEIKGKVGERLREFQERLPDNQFMVTIKCDLELPASINELHVNAADHDTLASLYDTMKFNRWRQALNQTTDDNTTEQPNTKAKIDINVQWHRTPEAVEACVTRLTQAAALTLRCYGEQADNDHESLLAIALSSECGQCDIICCASTHHQAACQTLLSNEHMTWIGHDLKREQHLLATQNFSLAGQKRDSQLMAYLLNQQGTKLDLSALADNAGIDNHVSLSDCLGSGRKKQTFSEVDEKQLNAYVGQQSLQLWQLESSVQASLNNEATLQSLLDDIDAPLQHVLFSMEKLGVLIDPDILHAQSETHRQRLQTLEEKAHSLAGENFNLGSPKQLQSILYDKLALPISKKTAKGQPSTAEEVLRQLALDFPLPKIILEWRSLSKLLSTYTEKLPKLADANQRLHTTYNMTGTSTGRLSSNEPNLQNIPVKTAAGRAVRQAFVAPKNHVIMAADYSQVELRIMAHLCQDPNLLRAFSHGEDIHAATASDIFNTPLAEVSAQQRRQAKTVNFGLLYGMSAFGLAKQLDIDPGTAKHILETYFERYPKVSTYLDAVREQAKAQGYIETCFGRRVYLPGIQSRNAMQRKAAERAAINAPMQGSAADIIKVAMLKVQDWINESDLSVRMIMQVHDELVFEVADAAIETATTAIRHCMTDASPLSVPLLVDIGHGPHWDAAH